MIGRSSRAYHSAMFDWRGQITSDPAIAGGQPVFRGTRVTLRTVLASLAEGEPVANILREFPTLTPEHVRAAIAIAASDRGH